MYFGKMMMLMSCNVLDDVILDKYEHLIGIQWIAFVELAFMLVIKCREMACWTSCSSRSGGFHRDLGCT